jgi:hypothetical protein
MAALSGRIAVACLALFAVTATGCMMSRPCNWDQWRYQSSDGRFQRYDSSDGSPVIALDQQARARSRWIEQAPARQIARSESSPEKSKVAQKRVQRAIEPVQWEEPDETPLPRNESKPNRQLAENANARAAKQSTSSATQPHSKPQVAGPTDRTPFNWGFFGAETRW